MNSIQQYLFGNKNTYNTLNNTGKDISVIRSPSMVSRMSALAISPFNFIFTIPFKFGFSGVNVNDSLILWACKIGNKDLIAQLLKNSPNLNIKSRYAPLHYACRDGDIELASKILNSSPYIDINIQDEFDGFSPLHCACIEGNEDLVKLFIEKKADIDATDNGNRTPLHWACMKGNKKIAQLLINADPDMIKDKKGMTPLQWAYSLNKQEIVDLFNQNGINEEIEVTSNQNSLKLPETFWGKYVTKTKIQAFTQHLFFKFLNPLVLLPFQLRIFSSNIEYNALHWACHCGNARLVEQLLHMEADPHVRTECGYTPLHIACIREKTEVVRLFVQHAAKSSLINMKDCEDNFSSLHWACFRGNIEIVNLLIQNGADIEAKDRLGFTPLHWACINGHKEVVEQLIGKGANIHAENVDGETALDWANYKNRISLIEFLNAKGVKEQQNSEKQIGRSYCNTVKFSQYN